MQSLAERFCALPLAGASLNSFSLIPHEKMLLRLTVVSNNKKTADCCELQFNRILYYEIDAKANPWFGLIESFSVSKDSDFLIKSVSDQKLIFVQINDFFHFSITGTFAQLDIISEDFQFALLRRTKIAGTFA